MSPHLHNNWLFERLFCSILTTVTPVVTQEYSFFSHNPSCLACLSLILSDFFYRFPILFQFFCIKAERRYWRTTGRLSKLCSRTGTWLLSHVGLHCLHEALMRKQKELVLIRLVWLPIFLFIAGSASKTFFQWTISPRVIYLFVCLFTFFFTNCVFPPLLEMLSISSRGRRVQALRGEPASPGYGAERGLALSAGSWAGAGAAPAAGTVQQHPGERPGRGSTADSARPFRATDCRRPVPGCSRFRADAA